MAVELLIERFNIVVSSKKLCKTLSILYISFDFTEEVILLNFIIIY